MQVKMNLFAKKVKRKNPAEKFSRHPARRSDVYCVFQIKIQWFTHIQMRAPQYLQT